MSKTNENTIQQILDFMLTGDELIDVNNCKIAKINEGSYLIEFDEPYIK